MWLDSAHRIFPVSVGGCELQPERASNGAHWHYRTKRPFSGILPVEPTEIMCRINTRCYSTIRYRIRFSLRGNLDVVLPHHDLIEPPT